MRLSTQGRELIKAFEGLSLTAYRDADGYSIGYGHYGAKAGDVISRAEADRLFDQDVRKFEDGVSRYAPVATQQQFDAMVSLAYNIGVGAPPGSLHEGGFAASTVARKHNAGDYAGAAEAFGMWIKSQGAVLPVLVKRREREKQVYLNGHSGSSFDGGGGAPSSAPSTPAAPPSSGAPPMLIAGVGLVFFCPFCFRSCDAVKVHQKP